MAVEIFIARHGQNEDNANGILNGHRDLPLTELGRQQARDLANGISELNLSFDAIYTSPLRRASETAEIVASVLDKHLKPVVIPQLIERNFGIMTGTPVSEIEERCAPNIIKANPITYFVNPEGAELFPEIVERGHEVLDIVRSIHDKGNVLLVCHGDIGKMTYAAATGRNWQDVLVNFHFGNGELIEISDKDDVHRVKLPQHNH